jgi:hypothetical protein
MAKAVLADLTAAFRVTMAFNYNDHGWTEKHFLSAGSRTAASAAALTLVQFRMNCLLASCEMTFAHINDLSPAKDGKEIKPFPGAVWPVAGSFGPPVTQTLNLGGATAGTFTLAWGNAVTGPITAPGTAAAIQTALRALAVPNASQTNVSGSAGVYTITDPPGPVSATEGFTGGFSGLTGATGPGISVSAQVGATGSWYPNNIENAFMLRCEGEDGQKWGNKWLHGIPDDHVSGGMYLGAVSVVTPPPAAITPIVWGTTTFDTVVGDYLSQVLALTVLVSKAQPGAQVQYTSYNITALTPQFVRDKKVGRPTRSRAGRAIPK